MFIRGLYRRHQNSSAVPLETTARRQHSSTESSVTWLSRRQDRKSPSTSTVDIIETAFALFSPFAGWPKSLAAKLHFSWIERLALILLLCVNGREIYSAESSQLAPATQNTDTLRLEQVIDDVIKHNDRLAAARYMEQAARDKIGPAGAWDDPMLMLGVVNLPTSFDFKMDDMTMKMIGLSQNIPYAGQKGLLSKAAKSEAFASGEDKKETALELATAAKSAFFDLYYRTRNLTDLQNQHDLLGDVVNTTAARLRTNQANQEDLLGAQADLARLESSIESAKQEMDEARLMLNQLRGVSADSELPPLGAPTYRSLPTSADQWLSEAKDHYPRLQKLNRQSEGYGFSAAAARRMRLPMLNLSANYGFRESSEMGPRDNMIGFQATLSLPFFSGRQQGAMARSMTSMQEASEAEAVQLWREVQSNILSLYYRSLRLSNSLKLYRDRVIPNAQDAYRTAFAGYVSNRTPFTTLLMYAVSIYRDQITANQIENELGKTLSEVERYITDPASLNLDQQSANTNK